MLDCDVYLRGSCLKMPTLFRKEGLLSSEVAVSIFLMILTQSTMFKDMYGARRQVRIRSVKLVKIKNNALLYVLYT